MSRIRKLRALALLMVGVLAALVMPAGTLAQATPGVDVPVAGTDPSRVGSTAPSVQNAERLAFTGPLLPSGHWAVAAVERAALLLLLPGNLSGQRGLPLEVVERALRQAMQEAAGEEYAALTELWYARLLKEFPGSREATEDRFDAVRLTSRYLGGGFDLRKGNVAPGLAEFEPDRTGALPLSDRATPVGIGRVSASLGRHLSVEMSGEADRDGFRVDGLEVAAGLGAWRVSLGRSPVAYGSGVGHGGVLMTGLTPINSLQIGTRGAVRLPWELGEASIHTLLGQMEKDRHPDGPYFWGANAQYQPHRRVTLGIQRAAMFGGDEPITGERLFSMLIGRVAGIGFENQIVSASGRLILPTEDLLPLAVHLEWGAEDAAGSWWAVPGIVAGVEVPSVPSIPALTLGAEYAHFATSCCGNPSWYRHWSFPGAWASGNEVLGHPLGGNGKELSARAAIDLASGHVDAKLFGRKRGAENLFIPGRDGRSHGIDLQIDLRQWQGWKVLLGTSHEFGPDWSESNLRVEVGHF